MKTLRSTILLAALLMGGQAFGQMQIDKAIQLTGSGSDAKIEGIQEITNNNDAANKIYVDSAIANRTLSVSNPTTGDMLYYDGANWATVPGGGYGENLYYCNGVPSWGGCPPELTTTAISSLSASKAFSGGTVLQDGGSSIVARGVCWNTTGGPTLADNFTTNGSGMGSFSSAVAWLNATTTYYVRAYATNNDGKTGYGNEIMFTTNNTYGIGDLDPSKGGIIFYTNGGNGYVATDVDQSTNAQWGCEGSTISNTYGTAIGTGQTNTTAIVNGCGTAGIAAKLCNDLVYGGFSDWFLPSVGEMTELYNNVGTQGLGDFVADRYWTSTQQHGTSSWFRHFNTGVSDYTQKGNTNLYTRCVRDY